MSSSAGQVILTGIVMLANPHPIDPEKGNRNLAFHATVPAKDAHKPSLGLLRYFTPENRVTDLQKLRDDDFTPAYVTTKMAAMPVKGVPRIIEEDDAFEYAFVGDITDVVLTENADIHRNPCVIASGVVDEIDSTNLTFKLTLSQYINLLHTVTDCHLSCFFDSDSKKWQNKKPMPSTGSVVSITGMLTSVQRGFDRKPTFVIELDNIAYLAPVSSPSTSASQYSPAGSPTSRYRFNYNTTSSSSNASKLSPLALGKRKEADDNDEPNSSAEDAKRSRTASNKDN